MTKVGIIRCQQTEDMCQGIVCFNVAKKGKMVFEEIGPVEVVGFVSCGGCPGKKAVTRAKKMVARGASLIALASCIKEGSPIGFPCPHFKIMKETIESNLDESIKVLEWTH